MNFTLPDERCIALFDLPFAYVHDAISNSNWYEQQARWDTLEVLGYKPEIKYVQGRRTLAVAFECESDLIMFKLCKPEYFQ